MKNIYLLDGKLCTGCGACRNICPAKAINMQPNAEGFLFPKIDEKKCIDCGLCATTCPQLNQIQYQSNTSICYAAICKNQ